MGVDCKGFKFWFFHQILRLFSLALALVVRRVLLAGFWHNQSLDHCTMASHFLCANVHLLKGAKGFKECMKDQQNPPIIQQSNYLKTFLLKILHDNLHQAYLEYGDNEPGPAPPTTRMAPKHIPKIKYDVIIVGAGMSGLSAAYELKRVGLTVKILEQTDRYGGRVFTFGKDAGLAPGLYGEGGAMRLPDGVGSSATKTHFMTDGYIKKFQLTTKAFPNYDKKGLSYIYGLKEQSNLWESNHFTTVWPDWRKGISGIHINDIDDYYKKTTGVVTNQLIAWLKNTTTIDEEIAVWDRWINIWSQFTLESFLESSKEVICAKLTKCDQDCLDVTMLGKLLPWSNDAVRGYSVFTYTQQLDQSLVEYLRDQLGNWWSDDMHTLVGGMHSLPEAFFKCKDHPLVANDIEMKQQVYKIRYHSSPFQPNDDYVIVSCYANPPASETEYIARAVILTTQVNILRQITFEPIQPTQEGREALRKNHQAIEDMFTAPSTKIILQTKTRFWEDNYGIKGGFSKTNLPIGQIHYVKPDPDFVDTTKQGIILIYTWKNEALLFGSLTKEQAKKEAIEQVGEIHPEIKEEGAVEKCIVHAWYSQPSYQGAYGLLKTTQFNNVRYLWEPMGNVHFAGDSISFTAGWIQGALESGFKSAYQVYARHMKRDKREGKC